QAHGGGGGCTAASGGCVDAREPVPRALRVSRGRQRAVLRPRQPEDTATDPAACAVAARGHTTLAADPGTVGDREVVAGARGIAPRAGSPADGRTPQPQGAGPASGCGPRTRARQGAEAVRRDQPRVTQRSWAGDVGGFRPPRRPERWGCGPPRRDL